MNIEYILLLFTIIACFLKHKHISIATLFCSVVTAYFYGTIDYYGLSVIIGFYAITYTYFQRDITAKFTKLVLLIIILAITVLLSLHRIPGFKNALPIDLITISPHSIPFSMYLNFDKTIAGIILFMNTGLYNRETLIDAKSLMTTFKLLCLCVITLMSLALLCGYIEFDFKIPGILLLWCINNLFFVCMAEEVIFRGIIQNNLERLSSSKYLSLALASLIFGVAHFQGGIVYISLASIAGGFYGLTYQKTGRILCAMLVHFGFNLTHFIFLTYPLAIKIGS